MSNSLFHGLYGLQPSRPLCLWNFPGKHTGVGDDSLLQGIFPAQGSNLSLLHCRQILYCLSQSVRQNSGIPWAGLGHFSSIKRGDPFPSWQKGLLVDYSFHVCFSYVILFVPMRCVLLRVPYCSGMNKEMTGQARPLSSPLLLTVGSLMDVSAHGCDLISFYASWI